MHFPFDAGLSVLTPATRTGLRRAASRIARVLAKRPMEELRRQLDGLLAYSDGSRDLNGYRLAAIGGPIGTVWWTCEAGRGRVGGTRGCAELPPGEEMQACGRVSLLRLPPSQILLIISFPIVVAVPPGPILLKRFVVAVFSSSSFLFDFSLQVADPTGRLVEHQRSHWKTHKIGCIKHKW